MGRSSETSASIATESRHTDKIKAATRENSLRAAFVVFFRKTSLAAFASSS